MAAARVLAQTPKQRSEAARRAAVMRWADVRATVRAAALPAKQMTRPKREQRLRLDAKQNGAKP